MAASLAKKHALPTALLATRTGPGAAGNGGAGASRAKKAMFSKSDDDDGDDEANNKEDSVETLLSALLARKAQHAKLKEAARALANKAMKDIVAVREKGSTQVQQAIDQARDLLQQLEATLAADYSAADEEFAGNLLGVDGRIRAGKKTLAEAQEALNNELVLAEQVVKKCGRHLQPKRNRTFDEGSKFLEAALQALACEVAGAVQVLKGV